MLSDALVLDGPFATTPLAHVQLTAHDGIARTMYRQCRVPHALAEVVDPLPIETLAYGAPSAAVVRVMLTHMPPCLRS